MNQTFRRLSAAFVWALLAAPATADDLSSVNVFPNPARAYEGHTSVSFANLPADATLRVYTSGGRLVREDNTGGAGTYAWGMTNEAGEPLASGVYIYRITTPGGDKKTGKIAIIR